MDFVSGRRMSIAARFSLSSRSPSRSMRACASPSAKRTLRNESM